MEIEGACFSEFELTGWERGEGDAMRLWFMFGLMLEGLPGAVFGRCVGEVLWLDLPEESCLACGLLADLYSWS